MQRFLKIYLLSPYILITGEIPDTQHFLAIIFFTHILLSFPGLCLSPALATSICMQDCSPHPWAVLWFASQCCPVRTHLSIPLYLLSISFSSHLVSSHLYSKVPCNLLKCRENRDRKPRTAQQPASGNSQKCHSGQEHCPLGPACPTSSTPTHEEEKKKEPMCPEHESKSTDWPSEILTSTEMGFCQ